MAVPVTDQDRTKALLEGLGFETRFDADLGGGFRWIDMAPTGVDTGIRLVTPDARAAHAELLAAGLEVGELLDWDTAPLMFSFSDLDGNRFYAVERD